jgi:hypothetical protein
MRIKRITRLSLKSNVCQLLAEDTRMLKYTDRKSAIEMAREVGMSDKEILKNVSQGIGGDERRRLIIEWGEALGYSASDVLRLAHRAGLIPSTHPPKKKEKPLQKD